MSSPAWFGTTIANEWMFVRISEPGSSVSVDNCKRVFVREFFFGVSSLWLSQPLTNATLSHEYDSLTFSLLCALAWLQMSGYSWGFLHCAHACRRSSWEMHRYGSSWEIYYDGRSWEMYHFARAVLVRARCIVMVVRERYLGSMC